MDKGERYCLILVFALQLPFSNKDACLHCQWLYIQAVCFSFLLAVCMEHILSVAQVPIHVSVEQGHLCVCLCQPVLCVHTTLNELLMFVIVFQW